MPRALSLGDNMWGNMHLMGRPPGLYPLGAGALTSTSHGPRAGSSLLPGENSQSPTLRGWVPWQFLPPWLFKTELVLGVPQSTPHAPGVESLVSAKDQNTTLCLLWPFCLLMVHCRLLPQHGTLPAQLPASVDISHRSRTVALPPVCSRQGFFLIFFFFCK